MNLGNVVPWTLLKETNFNHSIKGRKIYGKSDGSKQGIHLDVGLVVEPLWLWWPQFSQGPDWPADVQGAMTHLSRKSVAREGGGQGYELISVV